MNFKFKYWSNDNRGFHVKEVFCETIKQIKDTVISLKAERPDINNIEVYMGTTIVASLYDQ